MISVAAEHVEASLDVLRRCGDGRRECVVFWLAPIDDETVVNVVHPDHRASAVDYRVDDQWLTMFCSDLGTDGRRVVAQVHTHPGSWVGHSGVDDRFPVFPVPGLVSIVVPHFAGGTQHRDRFGVFRRSPSGAWEPDRGSIRW
jgi:proteasome lid subunit RPN8/RPN11